MKLTKEQYKQASLYFQTFTSQQGSEVFADMKASYCGATYAPGDTHQTAYQEGQRSVVLAIEFLLACVQHGVEVEDDEIQVVQETDA